MSTVACPRCRYELVASPQLAGQRFICPACQQPMVMPVIVEEPEEPPLPKIRTGVYSSSYAPSRTDRNPGVAAVLSFFWPGLGQIYNGQIGAGLFLLLTFLLCVLLSVLIVPAILALFLWVWGIYDAYSTAERLNRRGR